MKLLLTIISICLVSILAAQNVGINDDGSSPTSGAILDVKSSTKGMLIPRTTIASITSPTEGMMIYDTNKQRFMLHTGSNWYELMTEQDSGPWERDGTLIRQKSNYATDDFILGRNDFPQNGINVSDELFLFDKSKGAIFGGELNNSKNGSRDSIGTNSFGFGRNIKSKGFASVAFGQASEANGYGSSSFGFSSKANGFASNAIGWSSVAEEDYSIAIGKHASADMEASVGIGNYARARGENSISIGHSSDAQGMNSMALGYNTIANSAYETAIGLNNVDDPSASKTSWQLSDRLFVIGNGEPAGTPSNALSIYKNGNVKVGNGFPNSRFHVNADNGIDPFIVSENDNVRLKVNDNGSIEIGSNTGSVVSNMISIGNNIGIKTPNPQANIHVDPGINETALIIEYSNQDRLKFTVGGLMVTQPIKTPAIQDTDGDTKIEIEKTINDDKIRFRMKNFERIIMDEQAGNPRIDIISEKNNTIIGNRAGLDILSTSERNTFIGEKAGMKVTTGDYNVKVGYGAGGNGNGSHNTYIGNDAGLLNHGSNNLTIGSNAGHNNSGSNNTFIGTGAGSSSLSASGSVYIGRSAGQNATTSNRLYIDNSSTTQPLIYGEFNNDEVEINGDLSIDVHTGTSENTGELRFKDGGVTEYSFRHNTLNEYFYLEEDLTNTNIFYAEDGNFGVKRRPTTNDLEVNGTASKSSAGDWLANSDARLKKNINDLSSEEILNKMTSLQGITYEWNDHRPDSGRPEGIHYGFTAQDIQKVFPTLVSEDAEGYLQTSYGTFDAMYVESIKALLAKIETLEKEKKQQSSQIEELLNKLEKSSEKFEQFSKRLAALEINN